MFRLSLLSRATLVAGVCGILLLGVTIAASAGAATNEQLPEGQGKEKAESGCLTCHEARIIVQQRLNKGAWTKEVDKMVKWGAEVDPKDRDVLIDYLSANFTPEQPPYEAPRSAMDVKEKSKKGQ